MRTTNRSGRETTSTPNTSEIKQEKFLINLRKRELGKRVPINSILTSSMEKSLNQEFNKIIKQINDLQNAIKTGRDTTIEYSVADILSYFVESNHGRPIDAKKKRQHREAFVLHGGLTALLKIFSPPLVPVDARELSKTTVAAKAELWNEVLVILRELIVTVPGLTERLLSDQHMVFLFTMLSHQGVFDNVMNILEEVLASREDTFNLGSIPQFYSLVDNFSSRHLAHFCRVLSLLVFEPEDRQIMEGSHVLKSLELLQLRRNRMARNSAGIVERNQNLIIEMPFFFPRLMQILRVINYGPTLHDLIGHNITSQLPITGDVLIFHSQSSGKGDWNYLTELETYINTSTAAASAASTTNAARSSTTTRNNAQDDSEADITPELLRAFSPNVQAGSRSIEIGNILQVMRIATRLEIAQLSPLGQALMATQPLFDRINHRDRGADANNNTAARPNQSRSPTTPATGPSNAAVPNRPARSLSSVTDSDDDDLDENALAALMNSAVLNRNAANPNAPDSDDDINESALTAAYMNSLNLPRPMLRPSNRTTQRTFDRAKNELRFHAMMLAPHQIELIFVLCTLLSGRRKLAVQKKLAALQLHSVLYHMFDRMSWDAPPYTGFNAFEHIHGPNCECNPESAIRVQFLRLVHNFYDRDFLGNANKLFVLSSSEQGFIFSKGLLSTIHNVLHPEDQKQEKPLANSISLVDESADIAIPASDNSIPVCLPVSNTNSRPFAQSVLPLEKGLLTKIIQTLLKEKPTSTYRFWLSACIENFLRGCGQYGQIWIMITGILDNLLQHILTISSLMLARKAAAAANGGNSLNSTKSKKKGGKSDCETANSAENMNSNLQTSFDLLGELVKGSPIILEYIENKLTDDEFRVLMNVVMNNLVDSNVFLRSLFLSMELFQGIDLNEHYELFQQSQHQKSKVKKHSEEATLIPAGKRLDHYGFVTNALFGEEDILFDTLQHSIILPSMSTVTAQDDNSIGYLSHTWIQFTPKPLNFYAIDFYFPMLLASSTVARTYKSVSSSSSAATAAAKKTRSLYQEKKKSYLQKYGHKMPSTIQRKMSGDNNNEKVTKSNANSLLNLKQNVMGAVKDIRKSATYLLRFGTEQSSPPPPSQPTKSPSMDIFNSRLITNKDDSPQKITNGVDVVGYHTGSRNIGQNSKMIWTDNEIVMVEKESEHLSSTEDPIDESIFHTPPEMDPNYVSPREVQRPDIWAMSKSKSSSSQQKPPATPPLRSLPFTTQPAENFKCEETSEKTHQDSLTTPKKASVVLQTLTSPSSTGVKIPNALFRIGMFLLQEKYSILIRLMSTVTLQTINHENICCLNTTLLILLLDYQRGGLSYTLAKIRQVADKEYEIHQAQKLEEAVLQTAKVEEQAHAELLYQRLVHGTPTKQPDSVSSSTPTASSTEATEDETEEEEQEEEEVANEMTGSELVMHNFRELLWYWKEYYLRRGRDRLSIEFSSHIPFQYWFELVEMMCADNGSEIALLSSPISQPISPYTRPMLYGSIFSRGSEQSVLNLA